MQVGDQAPDVTITIADTPVRLCDFADGRRVVLYFYPKDSSPSCAIEARGFNAVLDDFAALDTRVLGVSTDDATSHVRFARSEGLRFPLATDPDGALARAFGAENRLVFGIVAKRVTFLINTDGHIARVWDRVNPLTHPRDVLDAVRRLAGQPANTLPGDGGHPRAPAPK